MARDIERAERAICEFLVALGFDPEQDPELRETPTRVAEAFATQLLTGYDVDLTALFAEAALPVEKAAAPALVARSPAGGGADAPAATSGGAWVLVKNLSVTTVCPHHLMPAVGTATVGYIAGERLFGFGAIAGLVDALSRRLTLQETISQGVVDALLTHAGALAAYCEITLAHSCLSARTPGRELAQVTTVATSASLSEERARSLALGLGQRPLPLS